LIILLIKSIPTKTTSKNSTALIILSCVVSDKKNLTRRKIQSAKTKSSVRRAP
jgi:hypothetical protein